jgi:hypothetical protein
MFSNMINELQEDEIPAAGYLASILKVALVKKQGVLQQPPACWSNDPKINPDSAHLLWAAVLLGSEDEIITAAGLMMSELMAKPGNDSSDHLTRVNEKILDIVDLALSPGMTALLKKKADQACKIISKNIS